MSSRPVGIALEGVPGIGKTVLWHEGVEGALRRGYRVIATVPSEPDSGLAFAGLGDLLDGVPAANLTHLPDPQRRALSVALMAESDEAATPDPRVLPRAVLGMLRAVCAEGALLVAIDDEHWLDRASARVLAFALTRLRAEPVGVLLARRLESGGMLAEALARGFGAQGLPVVAVGPLDARSIRDLVAGENGHGIPRAVMHRIYEMSAGNPLYALALAHEVQARPGRRRDLPIPRTLEDAIARRLEGLDGAARDALLVVAAVSRPTVALIHAVLSDFTLADLDGAVDAGVLEITGDRVRFTHPLLASTAYARAPAARRREIHRVIAKIIDDEEQRARHLALGAEAPDRGIAVAIEGAAQAAVRHGAPDVAADLLEESARLTPARDVEARRSRIVDAAELHTRSGDAQRARDLLDSLLPELSRGPLRGRVLFRLADLAEDWNVALTLLDEARGEAGDDYRLRVNIESLAAGFLPNRGEFEAALAHSRAALEYAHRTGDPALIAEATAKHATTAFFNGLPIEEEALRNVDEIADSAATTTTSDSPAAAIAELLFWSDDYDRGRPALERVVQRARERGERYDLARGLFELAVLELFAGNLELAERHRAAASDAVDDDEFALWLAFGEAAFAAARGDLELARTAAHRALQLAERHHDPLIGALPTEVLASVEVRTGDPAAAHELVHPVRESFLANGFGLIGSLSLPLWSVDIEALIACGRLDEAQHLLDDLLDRARVAENPNAIAIAQRCRGLLLAARGDIPAAIRAMDKAIAEHEHRTLRPELARTLLEKGVLQRRARQKGAAKQTLELAMALFEESRAHMWVDRARDELSRIGLRRSTASDGLTPAQARVAELVAAGKSNREIASALYMSQRSVEAHLTKIYREFGVRSRSQLLAAIAKTSADSLIPPAEP